MRLIFFTNILACELFSKTDIIEEVCTECRITTSNIDIWGKQVKYCPLCGREVSERKVVVNNYKHNVIAYFWNTFNISKEDLDKKVFLEPYNWVNSNTGFGFYEGYNGCHYIGCEVRTWDNRWTDAKEIYTAENMLKDFLDKIDIKDTDVLKLRISN